MDIYTGKGNNIALYKHCIVSGKSNILNTIMFKIGTGTFLVVQWLRTRLPTKRTWV